MIGFIIRRIIQSIVVVFGVTLIVFLLIHMLPGGPARALLGDSAKPSQIRYFNIENGYNKPVFVQYWRYIDGLFHGNLGFSYTITRALSHCSNRTSQRRPIWLPLVRVHHVIAVPVGNRASGAGDTAVDHALTGAGFVPTPCHLLALQRCSSSGFPCR